MSVWLARTMNGFRFLKLLTFIVLLILVIVTISACSEEHLPVLPQQQSAILFRGYPYSGIHDIYWKYDLNNKELTVLEDQEYIDLLDYVYFQGNKNNIDEKKVEHHYDIIGKNIANDFYAKLLARFHFNKEDKPQILYTVDDDDHLISQDHTIKVMSDHKNNTIAIIDLNTKQAKKVKVANRFWGQVMSPKDRYVAFFKHDPFAFSDGSIYKVNAVDLNTGETYVIKDLSVSLPTAMLWIEQRK